MSEAGRTGRQTFHPNANGHRQFGRCLTEFSGSGLSEGACRRGGDGNLHAVPGVTAPTAAYAGR